MFNKSASKERLFNLSKFFSQKYKPGLLAAAGGALDACERGGALDGGCERGG